MAFDQDAWCNSIAFHDFASEDVNWKGWFDFVLEICAELNVEPNKLHVKGEHYGKSTYYMSFKGGKKKLEKFNFEGIEDLTITQIIPTERKEYWDGDFTVYFNLGINLNDINESKEMCVISIDEKLMPFEQERFQDLAKSLQSFTNAKYGYYYRRQFKNDPHVYSMGGGGDIDSPNEEERLMRKWSDARCGWLKDMSYITGYLRDIYLLNFLSLEHLNWPVGKDQNLQRWIESDPSHGELQQLIPGLWSWNLEEKIIPIIRHRLQPSGIIITLITTN